MWSCNAITSDYHTLMIYKFRWLGNGIASISHLVYNGPFVFGMFCWIHRRSCNLFRFYQFLVIRELFVHCFWEITFVLESSALLYYSGLYSGAPFHRFPNWSSISVSFDSGQLLNTNRLYFKRISLKYHFRMIIIIVKLISIFVASKHE